MVPGAPSGGLSEKDEGLVGGGLSAQKVDIFTRQAEAEVWNTRRGVSVVSVSVYESKAKMVRFTTIEVRMEGAGLLILRTVWSKYS